MRGALARRVLRLPLLAALAAVTGACLELSGPPDGPAAIGLLHAAWPSVVEGDTLRDSTGAIAPLRVAAFDADGDTLRDAQVQVAVVGEPERALAVDAALRVVGLSVRGGAAASDTVIAFIGPLQTPKLVLATVKRPDYVTRASAAIQEQQLSVAPGDTAAKATSAQLTVHVWHRPPAGDSVGVPSWVVSYEVVDQPASTDGLPVAFVASSAVRSTRDTTDASGAAGRNLLVRAHRLAQARDTVVVRARVVYRGVELPGVNTLEFRVPLALGIAAP